MLRSIEFKGSDFEIAADDLAPEVLAALEECGRPGRDADPYVAEFRQKHLVTCDPDLAKAYLRGFGAWEEDELADHERNLDRLVWLIAGSIVEDGEAYLSAY